VSSLQTLSNPVKHTSAAWAILERWLAERGTYDAQARSDIASRLQSTAELPAELLAPEDIAEAQAIWLAASWIAEREAAGDEDGLASWRPARLRAIPMHTLRDQVLALYKPPLRSRRTLEMMVRVFNVLDAMGTKSSTDLTESLVAKMVASRPKGESSATIIQQLTCLRVIANFAKRHGYLRDTPFAFRPVSGWARATPSERVRWYTAEEVRKLMDRMEADVRETTGWPSWRARRLWGVSACCAFGGFRMTEAFSLFVEDINLATGIITVRARRPLKTISSARMVPMPPRLKKILEEEWLPFRQSAPEGFLDERGLSCPYAFPNVTRTSYWHGGPPGHTPLSRLKSVAQRAGIADFGDASFAKFRHAWATQAEFLGIPGAGIQRVMGHTRESTSRQHYRHSIAKNLTDTVAGFDY
jgi:integrase